MTDCKDGEIESPFVTRIRSADEVLAAEDVARMFKAYLDRIRRETEAISNNL